MRGRVESILARSNQWWGPRGCQYQNYQPRTRLVAVSGAAEASRAAGSAYRATAETHHVYDQENPAQRQHCRSYPQLLESPTISGKKQRTLSGGRTRRKDGCAFVGLGYSGPLSTSYEGASTWCLPCLDRSTHQRVLHRTVHVDDGVTAQLRFKKNIQLKDFTAPGVREIKTTPTTAVDNIFMFVNAFNLVLSFEMGGGGDSGTPTPWHDQFCLIQDGLRSLVQKVRAYVVRFCVDFTRTICRSSGHRHTRSFQGRLPAACSRSRRFRKAPPHQVSHCTPPSPTRRASGDPNAQFPSTRALVQHGGDSCLLQRSRMEDRHKGPQSAAPQGTKDGKRSRCGKASSGDT